MILGSQPFQELRQRFPVQEVNLIQEKTQSNGGEVTHLLSYSLCTFYF
jgi:hypothetical protein